MKERLQELQRYEQEAQSQKLPSNFSLPMPEEEPADRYASEDLDKYLPSSAKNGQNPTFTYKSAASYEPPSRARQCFAKLQTGFMIGGALGGAFGFLYGTYAAVVYKHVLYLPIAVVQAGGAFGFFLACGTVIRCDESRRSLSGNHDGCLSDTMMQPCSAVASRACDPCYCAVVSAIVSNSHQ